MNWKIRIPYYISCALTGYVGGSLFRSHDYVLSVLVALSLILFISVIAALAYKMVVSDAK
jgi:hypothetical protein